MQVSDWMELVNRSVTLGSNPAALQACGLCILSLHGGICNAPLSLLRLQTDTQAHRVWYQSPCTQPLSCTPVQAGSSCRSSCFVLHTRSEQYVQSVHPHKP